MPLGHTIRVIRAGEIVKSSVELGTLRAMQKLANGFINRFGGDCVSVYHNGHTVCSRKKNTQGALMPWKHYNKG